MSRQGFKHTGEVVSVESPNEVLISLRSATACDGCHAKAHCTVSGGSGEDGKVRQMRVTTPLAGELCVGEKVEVNITYSVGLLAVIVAYVLPLILFILTIAVAVGIGMDQGLAAVVAFAVAALYYGGVYLNRNKFERVVHFEVRKLGL